MKAKALSVLKYFVLLSLGIGLLYFAFRGIDFNNMLAELGKANYWWIAISAVCCLLAAYSRAIRWNMLIKPLGYEPKTSNTFAAVMVGYLANLALPRMGEITRCGSLNQSDKVPFDELIGTVVVERTLDLMMLLLAMIMAVFVEYDLIWGFLYNQILSGSINKLSTVINNPLVLGCVFICTIILVLMLKKLYNIRKQFVWFDKGLSLVEGIFTGIKGIFKMKNVGLFLFHTFFIWFMYFLMAYLSFFALGSTSSLGLKAGLFTLVIGGLGMTAPVQGGIGVYHILVSQGLTLFNIPVAEGLIYATIVHTAQTLLILLVGALSVIYLFFANKRLLNDQVGANKS